MKKPQLLLAGLVLLLIAIQQPLSAQKSAIFERISNHNYSTEWEVFQETGLIRISVKYSDCSDPDNGVYPESLLFKVENLSAGRIHAYWEWSFDYDGINTSKNESDEELVKITLEGFQTIEGDCDDRSVSKFKLYVQDRVLTQNSSLTDFSILELNVFEL